MVVSAGTKQFHILTPFLAAMRVIALLFGPDQVGFLSAICRPPAGFPPPRKVASEKFSTDWSLRQTDACWAPIRCCLTSTQCGTCVCGVGLIAGLGWAPTPHRSTGARVVQSCCICLWLSERDSGSNPHTHEGFDGLSLLEDLSEQIKGIFLCCFPALGWVSFMQAVWVAFIECCWAGQWSEAASTAMVLLDLCDRLLKLTDGSALQAAIHQAVDLLQPWEHSHIRVCWRVGVCVSVHTLASKAETGSAAEW